MALDFSTIFSGLNSTNGLLILIIFILFVLSMKKVFRIVMNAVWIVVAAVLFPIFASRVLGLPVPSDIDSILFLVTASLGLYFIYLIAKSIYSLLGFAEKVGRKMPKIEGRGEGKEKAKKISPVEKPPLGKPIEKQFFVQAGKTKSEKDLFKNYVVIEDKTAKEAPAHEFKKARIGEDEYVEIEEEKIKETEKKEYADLAKDKMEAKYAKIEKIPEMKFKKTKAKRK
jgi:hypothetical protein